MIIKLLEKVEELLESINVGGEQSRQFAGEIQLLKEVIGLPVTPEDEMDEIQRRDFIAARLCLLAIEASGLTAELPILPIAQWLDGTVADATGDVDFKEYDLAKLLRYVANVGVSRQT
jgi:hypothetical protein